MRLRGLFFIAQVVPAALIILTAGYGVWGLADIMEQTRIEQQFNDARYSVMGASFSNEEGRVDALLAHAMAEDPAAQEKARKDIKSHLTTAQDWITKFPEDNLPAEVRVFRADWIKAVNAFQEASHAYLAQPARGDATSRDLLREIQKRRSAIGAARYKMSPALEALVKDQGERIEIAIATFRMRLIMLCLISIGLSALCYLLMTRRVIRPLIGIAGAIDEVSKGNTEVAIHETKYNDEIGVLSRAVRQFVEQTRSVSASHADERHKIAAEIEKSQRFSSATSAFQNATDTIRQTLSSDVESLAHASQDVGNLAEVASSRASEFDHALSSTSRDVAEISALTQNLATSVHDVSGQVEQCARSTEAANRDVVTSVDQIDTLSSEIERIDAVLQTIETIASQTNLLALNATIEAARAGEAGRGFSVVATEVKALAGQTAHAVSEIEAVIGAIRGTGDNIRTTMSSVVARMQEAARLSNDLSARFAHQIHAIGQLSERTHSVSGTAQSMASKAVELSDAVISSADSARALDAISERITRVSMELDQSVSHFVETVAA